MNISPVQAIAIDTVQPYREADLIEERWAPVPGYEGLYEVSDAGRVKRLESRVRSGFGVKTLSARVVPPTDCKGYKRVNLWRDNAYKQFQVHRLVMLVFHGDSPLSVDHINGVPSDNRLDNLRYCTLQENTEFQHADGRVVIVRGEQNGRSKLTADKVRIARLLSLKGFTAREIGERVGVSKGTIAAVLNGRTWRHVA